MNNNYTVDIKNNTKVIQITNYPILYKYQPINDYSINALIKGEIWGTVPTIFNDPYDMVFCYSKSQIKKTITEKLTPQRIHDYYEFFKDSRKAIIIDRIMELLLANANDNFRQQYCIACFSEKYDSEIMWGHYANCAKGFVVAYNGEDLKDVAEDSNSYYIDFLKELFKESNWDVIKDIDKGLENLTTLVPIIYSNGKFNIDKEIMEILDPVLEYIDNLCISRTKTDVNKSIKEFIDKMKHISLAKQLSSNSAFYSALCYKSKAWSYEKEWRIWAYNSNMLTGQINNPHVLIGNVKPVALYLGERINSYDESILLTIAKNDLHIPVYKMETKIFRNSCKLKQKKT